jgi:hypothetical protein
MLTLTVAHTAGMSLLVIRKGLSKAWRRMQQSRVWRALRDRFGISHMIRAHEVTYGEHGWHPHLHVLLLCERPASLSGVHNELCEQWRHCVECELPKRCVPSRAKGIAISTSSANYVAKMGLEIASSATKKGRAGHMSPWQIAARIADGDWDRAIWHHYAESMSGCHQLQWSRGLKDAMGPTQSDQVLCACDDDGVQSGAELIGDIPRETWREMADARGALAALHHRGRDAVAPIGLCREWLRVFFERMFPGQVARWEVHAGRPQLRWRQNP